jgi:hypothetical protein
VRFYVSDKIILISFDELCDASVNFLAMLISSSVVVLLPPMTTTLALACKRADRHRLCKLVVLSPQLIFVVSMLPPPAQVQPLRVPLLLQRPLLHPRHRPLLLHRLHHRHRYSTRVRFTSTNETKIHSAHTGCALAATRPRPRPRARPRARPRPRPRPLPRAALPPPATGAEAGYKKGREEQTAKPSINKQKQHRKQSRCTHNL